MEQEKKNELDIISLNIQKSSQNLNQPDIFYAGLFSQLLFKGTSKEDDNKNIDEENNNEKDKEENEQEKNKSNRMAHKYFQSIVHRPTSQMQAKDFLNKVRNYDSSTTNLRQVKRSSVKNESSNKDNFFTSKRKSNTFTDKEEENYIKKEKNRIKDRKKKKRALTNRNRSTKYRSYMLHECNSSSII